MLSLKILTRRCASWNPNQGCLVLRCPCELTFDHGIDWNPNLLGKGYWPYCHTPCNASSTIKPTIVHKIHSSNLQVNLFGDFIWIKVIVCIHSYVVFKILIHGHCVHFIWCCQDHHSTISLYNVVAYSFHSIYWPKSTDFSLTHKAYFHSFCYVSSPKLMFSFEMKSGSFLGQTTKWTNSQTTRQTNQTDICTCKHWTIFKPHSIKNQNFISHLVPTFYSIIQFHIFIFYISISITLQHSNCNHKPLFHSIIHELHSYFSTYNIFSFKLTIHNYKNYIQVSIECPISQIIIKPTISISTQFNFQAIYQTHSKSILHATVSNFHSTSHSNVSNFNIQANSTLYHEFTIFPIIIPAFHNKSIKLQLITRHIHSHF